MILNIFLLLLGLAMVLVGSEVLVDGASGVARKWGVSEFVIGMTIVAFGTSAPEMVVSFVSAFEGSADMAVGNIIGSNIFNTAFILGLSALLCPVFITETNKKRDIPVNFGITVLIILLGIVIPWGTTTLSRIEGIIFLCLFGYYLYNSIKNDSPEESEDKGLGLGRAIIYTVLGLAALIGGGKIFVNNAESIAITVGLSDKFIGITILALGTSLPELASSLNAARKGKSQMALGTILGSNVFNVLLILGGAATIKPLEMKGISFIDFSALLVCSVVLLLGAFLSKKKELRYGTGAALLLTFFAYMTYLFMTL